MSHLLRCTPVLVVDRVEPSLAFFEQLGFQKTIDVPHGDSLGFAILESGGLQVMLQSAASVADDLQSAPNTLGRHTALFIEVDNLELAHQRVAAAPIFLPRRKTFYGADEIGVVEPGGHHITLAQFGA